MVRRSAIVFAADSRRSVGSKTNGFGRSNCASSRGRGRRRSVTAHLPDFRSGLPGCTHSLCAGPTEPADTVVAVPAVITSLKDDHLQQVRVLANRTGRAEAGGCLLEGAVLITQA